MFDYSNIKVEFTFGWLTVYDLLANSGDDLRSWVEGDDSDYAIEAFYETLDKNLDEPSPAFRKALDEARRLLFAAVIEQVKEERIAALVCPA